MRSFRLGIAPIALSVATAMVVPGLARASPAPDWRVLDPTPPGPALTVAAPADEPPPLAGGRSMVVAPFALSPADTARRRAVDCLTSAVYYEAATEPRAGQEAVAQVVLNRVRHPAFPKSVCGVVYDGVGAAGACQFTFACDGSTSRRPVARLWETARQVAEAALSGHVASQVGAATHYHAVYVSPYWRGSLTPVGRIGNHLFYSEPGWRGTAAALTGQYSGDEPAIPPPDQRANLAATQLRAAAPAERSVDFTVWGLKMATISVKRGRVSVRSTS